jgi:hypothetical protein
VVDPVGRGLRPTDERERGLEHRQERGRS